MTPPAWRRFHTLPRELRRLRREFWSARLRWQYDRSMTRYSLRTDHISDKELKAMLIPGETGRIDGFRFIASPMV